MNAFPAMRRIVLASIGAVFAVAVHADASYPNRPITVVVPFTAGGGSDIITRVVAQKLGEVMGASVVVDNRAGAGGTIGSAFVARSAADGYTLISLTTSTHAIAPAIYSKLPYDPINDFEPISLIGTSPYVLTVPASTHQDDLKTFLKTQKATGTAISFASAGSGTLAHLVGVQFCREVALQCEHVPYQGESASFVDLINNAVSFSFFNPIGVTPYVKSGKLRALAQTAKSSMLPDVPTFAELGVKGFDHNLWIAFAAPRATPQDVINKLNAALNKVLSDPAVITDLAIKGFSAKASTPQWLHTQMTEQRDTWSKVAKAANVKIQ